MYIPGSIAERLGKVRTEEITIGQSGASTLRLVSESGQCSYLKSARGEATNDLKSEHERLLWLAQRLPVPNVLDFLDDAGTMYLWTSEVTGIHAADESFALQAERLAETLAQGLRLIHSLDISDCPFDCRRSVKMAQAKYNVEHHLVDEADFDDDRQGRSATDLYRELQDGCPATEDLVFTHGDYCLPNIIVNVSDWTIAGFVDWGRAGVADRYQDLALAVRSLRYNFGEGYAERFLTAYGLSEPDFDRMAWYQLLDEFF